MEFVLQMMLLTVCVCLGCVVVLRRTGGARPENESTSIEVGAVSPSWLAEQRVKNRAE